PDGGSRSWSWCSFGLDRRQNAVRRDTALAGREDNGATTGPRALADDTRSSAHGSRRCQSRLEAPFRRRAGGDARQLWQDGSTTKPSRAARLARQRAGPPPVEHEGNASPDGHLGRLSTEFAI